jgi:Leucine-rich repeat (LRR) protein
MSKSIAASSSHPKRRWRPRYGLRTLLVVMVVLGIGLAYFANLWRRVQHQRQIVGKIEEADGQVSYSHQFLSQESLDHTLDADFVSDRYIETQGEPRQRIRTTSTGTVTDFETPPGPKAIRLIFGDDVYADVELVSFLWALDAADTVDPRVLLELPELKVVVLSGPQVNDEWLNCIAQVPKLRVLSLAGSEQGTISTDNLKRLSRSSQLESLSLGGSWVQDETVKGIAPLRQLRSLGLARIPNVTSVLFAQLDELTELRQLVVNRAERIGDENAEHLSQLQNLQTLWLIDTSISDATLLHVSQLTRLQWLDLSQTNVGDSGMVHLAKLANLKRLNLAHTYVGDQGLLPLARLPQLRHLKLGGANITDDGLPVIGRMTQLESLELWPSFVTDDGLTHLRTLTNLKQLSVGPHITEKAADKLRQALPNCEIRRVDAHGSSGFPDG